MSVRNSQNESVGKELIKVPDVVDAPTIGTATAGIESATVSFTPAVTGGAASSYTAISTPGSITGSSSTSPISVSGLTGGTAYTFKVYGTNSSGTWSTNQSAASNSITPTLSPAFESIASATGTGSSGTITFSSIPGTYRHLQIRYIARGDTVANTVGLNMQFNSDTGSNYTYHRLEGDGASTFAAGGASQTNTQLGTVTAASATANIMGVGIVDIHDYASTSKYKTARMFGAQDRNGAGNILLRSGLWMSTSAITSITITTSLGNFTTTSQFALYGIKG